MLTWHRSAQQQPNPDDRLVARREHDWVSWRVPGPSWHVAALGLVILVLAVGGSLWFTLDWLERVAALRMDPNAAIGGKDVVSAKLDAVKIALSAVAGGVALFALYLAVRRQMTAERDLRAQLHAQANTEDDARARRVTELYTKASEQLGSDKVPVRLASLYALERLGQDNPDQRATISQLWCAYLRMPYTSPPPTATRVSGSGPRALLYTPPPPTATRVPGGVPRPLLYNSRRRIDIQRPRPAVGTPAGHAAASHAEAVLERDVRLSVQRLLAKHLRRNMNDRGQSHDHYWPEILELDLTEATLVDLDLSECHLPTIRLVGATFIGGIARFQSATFAGRAHFERATFDGYAYFDSTTFTAGVGFGGATFREAWFTGTTFCAAADFYSAAFKGDAKFTGATFRETRFIDVTFFGDAHFDDATFLSDGKFHDTAFASVARCGNSRALGRRSHTPGHMAARLDVCPCRIAGSSRDIHTHE
ncbi:pentapeptide repeat protein [Lentzea atacamensis]|uniref:Pentapeptide repeat protein n=1 Tax=Lentzea atacamensis TaxID=531938 RepID=A0A316H905_9PSEU|nr:pentapeptide repeat-containing protein [Lentzea atacamensis]PWK77484.1 pentapeptide repeat protein [Lentzea atacamensis]